MYIFPFGDRKVGFRWPPPIRTCPSFIDCITLHYLVWLAKNNLRRCLILTLSTARSLALRSEMVIKCWLHTTEMEHNGLLLPSTIIFPTHPSALALHLISWY